MEGLDLKKKSLGICLLLIIYINVTACMGLTAKYYYESAMSDLDEQNYESANEQIAKAIESEPDKKEYYICRGLVEVGLKDYKKAEEDFNNSISKDSDDKTALENNKNAYRGLGIVNMYNAKYDEAIKYFDMALKIKQLENIDIDILKYKAETYLKSGAYDKVDEVCNDINKKDQNNSDLYVIKGRVLLAKKDYENAQKQFDSAISNDNMSGYYYKALVCGQQKDSENMIKNYHEYMDKDSNANKGLIYGEISTYLVNEGAYDEALKVIKEGLSESNESGIQTLKYNEIAVYEKKQDYNTAIAKSEEYLKEYPNDENVKKELAFLKTRV